MPIVKRYTFQPRVSAGLASQFNTNFDDIIDAFNNHRHSGVGTDAPNITISGIQNSQLVGQKNPYKFAAYRAAALTLSAGAFTKITFDAELFDSSNNFASGTYTAPIAGYYQFNWTVGIATGAQNISTALYVNGVSKKRGWEGTGGAGFPTILPGCALVKLAAADTVDLYGYAATALGVSPGEQYTRLEGFLVSG